MEDSIEKLKQILSQELEITRKLLELSKRKRKLLLEKFSTELLTIVSEEEQLVTHLVTLEEQRRAATAELAGNPSLTLEQLLEHIKSADSKSDLWHLGTQLKDVGSQIRTINEENQKLLEQALELTQYTIKLIAKIPGGATYAPKGSKPKQTISALIDRKA